MRRNRLDVGKEQDKEGRGKTGAVKSCTTTKFGRRPPAVEKWSNAPEKVMKGKTSI